MTSPVFITVNDQLITLEQATHYLQIANKFQPFLLEILYQHVIDQELQSQSHLKLPEDSIEQILINFRLEQGLTQSQDFEGWLNSNGLSYETFRQQYIWRLNYERLKLWLSQPRLEAYFEQRKPFLDQVILSWVFVEAQELADALHQQIKAGAECEQLADVDVAIAQPLIYGELPEELQNEIAVAQPGSVLEPLLLNDNWYVVRVEEFCPVELNDELAHQLRDEIFAQWLSEQISAMSVKLEVN